ncbi:MAG: hypothetical protein ABJA67_08500 [Chthonomonadales bacterium]
MAVEDARQRRLVHHELTRRYVDFTQVDVQVVHGVCYLRGIMRQLRTHPEVNLDHEAEIIQKTLMRVNGIRSVVWDVRTMQ